MESGEADLQATKRPRHLQVQADIDSTGALAYAGQVHGVSSGKPAAAGPLSTTATVEGARGAAECLAQAAAQSDQTDITDGLAGTKANPLALPAASQQYPVLPQAAAAVASAVPGLAGAPQHKHTWGQAAGSTGSAGKKQSHPADPQQQRRRAGPVNQWRPGMSLVTPQPLVYTFTTAPQQLPQGAAANPQQHWPTQPQHLRQSGPAGSSQQVLQGGASFAAALQNLLPLPGQLIGSSHQLLPTVVLQKPAQLQQQRPFVLPSGAQSKARAQGITAAAHTGAVDLSSAVLVPSAPQAARTVTPENLAFAQAGGRAPASQEHVPADRTATPAAAGGAGHVRNSGAVFGATDLSAVGSPGWLKLLSCAVEQQGDSLALELLLGGQLYKGQLTRVALTPATDFAAVAEAAEQAPGTSATNAAAAAGGGGGGSSTGVEGGSGQLLSESEKAALAAFAQQREGICFLCALPFVKQESEQQQTAVQQQQQQQHQQLPEVVELQTGGAALPSVALSAKPGSSAATAATAAGAADTEPPDAAARHAAAAATRSVEAQTPQEVAPAAQLAQQQDTPEAQTQDTMVASLGGAVSCDVGVGCQVLLHAACADWSAKASARQLHQLWQQGTVPGVRQLLACLPCHCCGCDQRAASLQCEVPGCGRMFHVPCVNGMGAALLQDGSCWCSDHKDVMQQAAAAAAAATAAAAAVAPASSPQQLALQGAGGTSDPTAVGDSLSSPEPSRSAGINPSPSFAAALVLQQMRCSKGYDVLLVGPEQEPAWTAGTDSNGAGSSHTAGGSTDRFAARSSAQRRLLEAMPNGSSGSSGLLAGDPWQRGAGRQQQQQQPAGLYGSTAEGSRQYHLQQQQQGGYGFQGPSPSAPGPATTMLLQALQQSSLQSASQQHHVGPHRRSPRSSKGRPPLHAPSSKSKGWNTLGLISAFALAQQHHEVQQEQQQAASQAAAAAVAVSGPTVVVPRVRARKGAVAQHAPPIA